MYIQTTALPRTQFSLVKVGLSLAFSKSNAELRAKKERASERALVRIDTVLARARARSKRQFAPRRRKRNRRNAPGSCVQSERLCGVRFRATRLDGAVIASARARDAYTK